jgi:peptidoglycan/LPS O-acetylase OafA/YrhL
MGKRNHALDVVRCIAIASVVNCHAVGASGSSADLNFLRLGGKGVDLFFVLSGWLLGHQLLSELKSTHTLDIARFWYRRWLRTLPAYYAVLALTFAWQIVGRGNVDLCGSYLFFGQNYLSDLPYFSVSWSLCVEEHFYLLVAPLLLLFFRMPWARYTALPILLLIPSVCRAFGWYHSIDATHVRYDQCAAGVVLAALSIFVPKLWTTLCRFAPWLAAASLIAVAFNVFVRIKRESQIGDFGILPYTLIFASWILLANSSPYWQSHRVFGARYLADRSYAVYLLHGEAFALLKRLPQLPFLLYLALAWLLSLLLAEMLYRGVERPILRAREKFAFSCSRSKATPVVVAEETPSALRPAVSTSECAV